MDNRLNLAIETIFTSLTATWEDNGNIMAEAVRDQVLMNLSSLTGKSIADLEKEAEVLVEKGQ